MRNLEKERAEFNQLFEELTGIPPANATIGEDGFFFIPPETKLGEKDDRKRKRIGDLAGFNGWRNHIVNDQYAGWWIRPPLLSEKSLAEEYKD